MGDFPPPGERSDRPPVRPLEYQNTIVAVDENVEMAAAWTAVGRFQLPDRIVLHLYECTNEMVLSTKKPVADVVKDRPLGVARAPKMSFK
jgi:hypothetical protein